MELTCPQMTRAHARVSRLALTGSQPHDFPRRFVNLNRKHRADKLTAGISMSRIESDLFEGITSIVHPIASTDTEGLDQLRDQEHPLPFDQLRGL